MKEWVMYIELLLFNEHKYSFEFKLQFIWTSIAFIISIIFYFTFVENESLHFN